jgi:hypothetical protein
MFETKHDPLAPLSVFLLRLAGSVSIGVTVVALSIFIGILGFHFIEGMPWLNAFENSAMILSTMGPVQPVMSNVGKFFVSFYALFAGLIFFTMMGVMFSPVIHRFLHKFHRPTAEQFPGIGQERLRS